MAVNVEQLRAGGPGVPARPLVVSRARTKRRLLLDRLATRTVVLGGLIIIASILAILVVIVAEIVPLFRSARATAEPVPNAGAMPAGAEAVGIDEYREIAYVVGADGMLRFVPLRVSGSYPPIPVAGLDGARITAAADLGRGRHMLGTSDGRVIPAEISYEIEFKDGKRTLTPKHEFKAPAVVDPDSHSVMRVAAAAPDSGAVIVAQVGPSDLVLQSVVERKALIGGTRREESLTPLPRAADEPITALAIDLRGDDLFAGTAAGRIVRYDLRDRGSPARAEVADVGGGRAVSVLRFLNGDRTLVAGTEGGDVVSWQVIPAADGAPRLTPIHRFAPHPAPIVAVAVSHRDKSFVTVDRNGGAHVSYGTSGARLLELKSPAPDVRAVIYAPKADGIVTLDSRGGIAHWRLDNPHPEITLGTLFGKVWYEGYRAPAWVWQSTGGTDDFEAKFSLTPLVYGTLKGTFYALVIAVPLALLAALYVSEFMHPALKAWVKPMVEIMAALPSVVLGFLAGLWLAPVVERIVPGLFMLPIVTTPAILLAMAGWRWLLPATVRGRFRPGSEVFVLLPVVVGSAAIAFALGGLIEARLLAGDYRGWLLSALGLTYDQRNSLVVGVAMGFAVIPIIFTIAEDSLTNVPQHLRAGSLAMGATRWQTAVRIVLPTASPGIFSAVMIGFGRAVGETMIVLMATGNTPVMDANIFSGFRALSANIAVELPEAPEGGTLFRVLFLAAFLLFCLTFAVNTVAEVVRLKLRQRYRYL